MDNSVEFFIRKLRTRTGEVIMTGMTSFSTRNKKHPKKSRRDTREKAKQNSTKNTHSVWNLQGWALYTLKCVINSLPLKKEKINPHRIEYINSSAFYFSFYDFSFFFFWSVCRCPTFCHRIYLSVYYTLP